MSNILSLPFPVIPNCGYCHRKSLKLSTKEEKDVGRLCPRLYPISKILNNMFYNFLFFCELYFIQMDFVEPYGDLLLEK